MKRTLVFGMALMLSIATFAQKNVTQFMGIPIDGTKSAMIQKLKAKGFTYNASDDELSGEFNGKSVNIRIVTNNNKVYRVFVTDAVGSSVGNIRINFNKLCNQFEKNGKYLAQNLIGKYEIGEDEDISYEMTVHNKRYQAAYYQITEADMDTTGLSDWAFNRIMEEYGVEGWQKMSEEESEHAKINLAMEYLNQKVAHKSVWFMITERFGRYYINIFYDNELNQANGEDL